MVLLKHQISHIINGLEHNRSVFEDLFSPILEHQKTWKPEPHKWSLLEVLCHLYDEEREDFKTRVRCLLQSPVEPPPLFDPTVWVTERRYIDQNYDDRLSELLNERTASIDWLNSLEDANWLNEYEHPKMGIRTPLFYLSNWLAHDFLHIRQIMKLKLDYLNHVSGTDLNYAGTW